MKRQNRIKKNEEFQTVFNKGSSTANRQFVVYMMDKPDQAEFRIGLSVSKKVGNAVMRNQIKRYIRQAFLELKGEVKKPADYIIIARKPVTIMDYHGTKKSLVHVLKRANAIRF